MNLIKYLTKGYAGAGILYYHKTADGKTEVLLGHRSIKPDLGKWSIPGGKRHRGETPLQNAIREATEEGFAPPVAIDRDTVPVFRIPLLHFFDWSTFLVRLEQKPDLNKWPTKKFRDEFSEVKWMDVNALEENTHMGVKAALAVLPED